MDIKIKDCEVLNTIKNFEPEKRSSFTLEDVLSEIECPKSLVENSIKTYIKLGIIKKIKDNTYMVQDMCMLSQFS